MFITRAFEILLPGICRQLGSNLGKLYRFEHFLHQHCRELFPSAHHSLVLVPPSGTGSQSTGLPLHMEEHLSVLLAQKVFGVRTDICASTAWSWSFFFFFLWWQEICMSFSLGKNVTITVSNFKQKIHFPPSSLIRSSLFKKLEGMQVSSEFTWSLESTF